MKRFDPVAAVFGLMFILTGIYFLDSSNQPSFKDLGVVIPIGLIVGGLAVAMRNVRGHRRD
jgi:hypothetical protein